MSEGNDIITVLERDVEMLIKRATELTLAHNRSIKELERLNHDVDILARNQSELSLSLKDLKSILPKEVITRLYGQISEELSSTLQGQVEGLKTELSGHLQGQVEEFSERLVMVQEDLVKVREDLTEHTGKIITEQFTSLQEDLSQVKGEITQSREEVIPLGRITGLQERLSHLEEMTLSTQGTLSRLEEGLVLIQEREEEAIPLERVQGLQEQLSQFTETLLDQSLQAVHQEQLSQFTEESGKALEGLITQIQPLQELLDTVKRELTPLSEQISSLSQRVNEIDQRLPATELTALREALITCATKEDLAKYLTKEEINPEAVLQSLLTKEEGLPPEGLLALLTPLLRPALEQVVEETLQGKLTQLNNIILTKQEHQETLARITGLLSNTDHYLSQDYFTQKCQELALKEEVLALRAELRELKCKMATRDHLSLLRAEHDNQALLIHHLQQELEKGSREYKSFLTDQGVVQYFPLGEDLHLLFSRELVIKEDLVVALTGVDFPKEEVPINQGELSGTLSIEGVLTLKKMGEREVVRVKQWMLWY